MAMVDKTDTAILRHLYRNARISNAELAEAVNLTPTPCLRRLRKMEQSGLIQAYRAELDYDALGFGIVALAFVKLVRNSERNAEAFERAVKALPAVRECSVVTGSFDYVLRLLARNLSDYEVILKKQLGAIDTVADIESTIVLKQVQCSAGLPD